MSFYTGKYNGKTQCHITKGAHDISSMRGAPFSNTVFHTDINYLDYKIFNLSNYTSVNTTLESASGDRAVKCYKITGELSNYIFSSKYAWSIYDKYNGKIYHDTNFFTLIYGVFTTETIPPVDSCLWTDNPNKKITVNATKCATVSFPKQTYQDGYEWIVTDKNKNLEIIVWGLKDTGTLSSLYSQDRTGEIRINKSMFNVGGYDVINMKYLSPNMLNTIDIKLNNEGSGNSFQLINSISKNNSIEIISNSIKTEIKKGGHTILSSDVGSTMLDSSGSVTSNTTWVYSGDKNSGTTWTHWQNLFSKTFQVGEVVVLLLKPTIDGTWNPCTDVANSLRGTAYSSSMVIKYNEGYICDLSSYRRDDNLIIRNKQFYGSNGKILIKNEMIISSSYSGQAGMTSFGGIVTAHSLK